MGIVHKGTVYGTNTVTLPSHASGDVFVGLFLRLSSSSAPTLPTGWTSVSTNNYSFAGAVRGAYFIATSSSTTNPVSNSTQCSVACFGNVSSVVVPSTQRVAAICNNYDRFFKQAGWSDFPSEDGSHEVYWAGVSGGTGNDFAGTFEGLSYDFTQLSTSSIGADAITSGGITDKAAFDLAYYSNPYRVGNTYNGQFIFGLGGTFSLGFDHLDIENQGFKNMAAGSGFYLQADGPGFKRVSGTEDATALLYDAQGFKVKGS